jgi:hypothetical protein
VHAHGGARAEQRESPGKRTSRSSAYAGPAAKILALQSEVGNRAVGQLLRHADSPWAQEQHPHGPGSEHQGGRLAVQRAGWFDGLRAAFGKKPDPKRLSPDAKQVWREYGTQMLPNLEAHVRGGLSEKDLAEFKPRWAQIQRRAALVAQRNPQDPDLVRALREIRDIRLHGSSTAAGSGLAAPTKEKQAAIVQWDAADEQVKQWASKREHPTLDRMMKLHRILAKGQTNNDGKAGKLRDANHAPPMAGDGYFIPGSHVRDAMRHFITWYDEQRARVERNETSPVELAARTSQYLISIHPFTDGNGRLSRLVMDWVCRLNQLPPPALGGPDTKVFAAFGRTTAGHGADSTVTLGSRSVRDAVEAVTRRLEDSLDRLLSPESVR